MSTPDEMQHAQRTPVESLTLEQVPSALKRLQAEESSQRYRLGLLFNLVVKQRLAQAAGYATAPAYFRENIRVLSSATLYMYGVVAEGFSELVCLQFGFTRLHLLLIYENAADFEVDHEAPGDTLIEVPEEDGAVRLQPFSACSVEELRRAIRRKRKPASSMPLSPEARAQAEQYREAVVGGLPKGVQVRVRNDKGKAVVDLIRIPLEQVGALVEALQGVCSNSSSEGCASMRSACPLALNMKGCFSAPSLVGAPSRRSTPARRVACSLVTQGSQ